MLIEALVCAASMKKRFGQNIPGQNQILERILAELKSTLPETQLNAISQRGNKIERRSVPKAEAGQFYERHPDLSIEGYEIARRKETLFEPVLLSAIICDRELNAIFVDVQFHPDYFQRRNLERRIKRDFPNHATSVQAASENLYDSFGKYIGSTAAYLDHYFARKVAAARKLFVGRSYEIIGHERGLSAADLQMEFIAGLSAAVNKESLPEYGGVKVVNLSEMISFAQLNWTDVRNVKKLYLEYGRIRGKSYNVEKLFRVG